MTPRNASSVSVCGQITTAALIVLCGLVSACSKDSALPTAPSSTTTALSIEGVVRPRSGGDAVAGARVEIVEGTNQGTQVSTDPQGRYRFSDLAAGSLVLRALADGYSAGSQAVTLSTSQTIDFLLDPSESARPDPPAVERFTLAGSITDSRNESPVRGARVKMVGGPDTGQSTETDASGRYHVSVLAGAYTIEVSASSFARQARNVSITGNQVVDFELHRDSTPAPDPPPPAPTPPGPTVKGTAVNAVSDTGIAGATVRVDGGGQTTTSGDGSFEVALSSADSVLEVSVSSASTIERVTRVRTASGPATLTLIPKSLNITAFDQMFRSDGVLRRWTAPPTIIVQRSVLQFTDVDATSFVATDTVLTDAEVDAIVADLQAALPELSGGTFDRFASIAVETSAAGDRVSVTRTGAVIVAQYLGLADASTYWGYTRWAWNDRGEMRAASMMLDRAFETSGSQYRRSLRTHELGHAMGYAHVDVRLSVMNASGRVAVTDFDRDGARIAFMRPPMNMSPDVDPDPLTVNRAPSAGLTWNGAR